MPVLPGPGTSQLRSGDARHSIEILDEAVMMHTVVSYITRVEMRIPYHNKFHVLLHMLVKWSLMQRETRNEVAQEQRNVCDHGMLLY
jgi:hypothetical protein